MNCNVRPGKKFLKEFKRLYKHYKSLKGDVDALVVSLKDNPTQGADLGGGIRKVRMAITSKGKGKSGGARVITLTVLVSVTDLDVWLLTLYDKSERETITDSEIAELRRQEGLYYEVGGHRDGVSQVVSLGFRRILAFLRKLKSKRHETIGF